MLRSALVTFGEDVTAYLTREEEDPHAPAPAAVTTYAHSVERAASDIGSRRQRDDALTAVLKPIFEAETDILSAPDLFPPKND